MILKAIVRILKRKLARHAIAIACRAIQQIDENGKIEIDKLLA